MKLKPTSDIEFRESVRRWQREIEYILIEMVRATDKDGKALLCNTLSIIEATDQAISELQSQRDGKKTLISTSNFIKELANEA